MESGKLSLSPVKFSIVETVENLVNISQPMIKEKNIDFSFHINRMEKEYLYTDQLRLNQIYINILSNAIKYTEPGGKVSVNLREEASEQENCVKLTYVVADTGIGMSKEYMETMYQPFSRQIDSRVNSIQGTGLGLAITKQMVELIGGTIDCESESGKGTTFTVVLNIPVADKQWEDMQFEPLDVLVVDDDPVMPETAVDSLTSLGATAETAGANGFVSKPLFRSTLYQKINDIIGKESSSREPEDDHSDLVGLRILIAEANDINWEIISLMLSMYGIETERAENGRICVEKMQKAHAGDYTLIFMDVQMPEMNGLDATTSCHINVAGGYDNFEAPETEFDRFNVYYPNVELVFTKVDDYNNMIGTVLNGNDAPDIYVNYSWMYGRDQYKSSIDDAIAGYGSFGQ
ncbi:MAG: response regulator [Lachnospiraceae bacterium]|nr:response regulator [Lachnospiraceae bacterium]